ncbi:hypothetical protein F2P81_005872 [Scophthalmus maximus]|nr:hypothetical protein F2P81_005872 [Scophthalmus maximus]
MEVQIGMEVVRQPRASPVNRHACLKCMVALATAMGLVIVALVAGFVLQYFVFAPSCNQDARPLSDAAKVHISRTLKKGGEQGSYDIFTVDKTATYLIYGWVKLSDVANEEIVLKQTDVNNEGQNEGTIQKRTVSNTEIFFFEKLLLANGVRISITSKSVVTDGLFHFYEL